MTHVNIGGLRVDEALHAFVAREALPGTGINPDTFWEGLGQIIRTLTPKVRDALERRDQFQTKIDGFMAQPAGRDPVQQETFLKDIGYIEPEPGTFSIGTHDVDEEISHIAGPQLVVPVTNARYALNAANARWGSLYDAFYGTDALARDCALAPTRHFNPLRGRAVVRRVRALLDEIIPLMTGSHGDVTSYYVRHSELHATLECGRTTGLQQPMILAGFTGAPAAPRSILLRHHGLHIELMFDRESPIGSTDKAGIADVIVESAVSTIIDAEDSVAAVDAEDKILVYRNWLGLMRGTLTAAIPGPDGVRTRRLADDRTYMSPLGEAFTLPGRSLLLFRTVGWHMFTDAVLDETGREVPEGILDTALAAAIALHDINGNGLHRNSRTGSVYLVRPKMHGSAEVGLSDELFAATEDLLGLKRGMIKLGLMDEERRTSVNLAACLHAARDRVFFINTGFLDRTGDEIHTCLNAGPVVRKGEMRNTRWIAAYEQRNVAIGLACGLRGRGQIGKGMWAIPDRMADMLKQKGAQLEAGASTAWIPSPTAATLHALHYHMTDVANVQHVLRHVPPRPLTDLLETPVVSDPQWSPEEIAAELDTNIQGILGYVVRWVDLGIGCSRVPDLDGVGLMEDRATLRISSQHVANWLQHGIVTLNQVEASLRRMAAFVDDQNRDESGYRPLGENLDGPAFRAARELITEGTASPNGYTESILHRRRREAKAIAATEATIQPERTPVLV